MVYYEVCNLYEEHYSRKRLMELLKHSNFVYFGILHDKDYFPTGEAKKPHFHLILGVEGDSRHTKELITSFFNDSSIHIRSVRNPKGYVRYLTHKDNLEKAQYSDKDIFTSDRTLYEELVNRAITISNTDNILLQFKEYVMSPNFNFNDIVLSSYTWFESKGKIDYFLKNRHIIVEFVNLTIQLYLKMED